MSPPIFFFNFERRWELNVSAIGRPSVHRLPADETAGQAHLSLETNSASLWPPCQTSSMQLCPKGADTEPRAPLSLSPITFPGRGQSRDLCPCCASGLALKTISIVLCLSLPPFLCPSSLTLPSHLSVLSLRCLLLTLPTYLPPDRGPTLPIR